MMSEPFMANFMLLVPAASVPADDWCKTGAGIQVGAADNQAVHGGFHITGAGRLIA